MSSKPQIDTSNTVVAEKFYRYFQNELAALQEQIGRLEQHSTTGGERTDAIEHCSAGIARLNAQVRDVIDSLPAHDQQSYSDSLKALTAKFQAVKSHLVGKQKFSFKNSVFKVHKNESAISLHDAAQSDSSKDTFDSLMLGSSTADDISLPTTPLGLQAGISGIRNQVVVPRVLSSTLSKLSRVVVDMSKADSSAALLQTLTMRDISDSIIICPKLDGPIHLTNISKSIIAVDCRQFRMHSSDQSDIYLHCTSRPIIEDCTAVRFAPADGVAALAKAVQGTNMWNRIDDFKWLRAEQSPHWSILPEPDRVSLEGWKRIDVLEDGTSSEMLLKQLKPPN